MAFEREMGEKAGSEIKEGIKYFSDTIKAIFNSYMSTRFGSGFTRVGSV